MTWIELSHLVKRYAGNPVVKDLSLEIAEREFVTLLGPSGCGKTTTLRMLAGFIRPDGGTIAVAGQVLSSPEGVVPPEKRRMGMVFQNYAVWPHKTVFENVAFGLQVQRLGKKEIAERVARMLDLVGLSGLEKRYPNQLSGGQQQRVALGRSLVVEPSILLLDEPLSNLDAKLRERMRWELKQIQRRTGITFVYVTHDQAEAMALSDRVVVMHLGEIHQVGTPREVYVNPANRVVAEFMGLVNLVSGCVVEAPNGSSDALVRIGSALRFPAELAPETPAGAEVLLAIRPENIRLDRDRDQAGPSTVLGRVEDAVFLGNFNDYQVAVDDLRLRVQAPSSTWFEVGEAVWLTVQRATAVR